MKLYFTLEEKKVIIALAMAMVAIDGVTQYCESVSLVDESLRLGLDPNSVIDDCMKIEPESMIKCVSKMSIEQKKYVYSVLCKVMASDSYAHPKELSFLAFVTMQANLPKMSIEEAKAVLLSLE